MSFLKVIGSDNNVEVDSGVYYPNYVSSKFTVFNPNQIKKLDLEENSVNIIVGGSTDVWRVSFDGSEGTLKVDTINGIAPTDNLDLCRRLGELMRS